MFEEKDDTIMARWLAGNLTPEEQAAFELSSEYKTYEQIRLGLDRFEKPDFKAEGLRQRIWEKAEASKTNTPFRLKPLWYLGGLAASLLLVFGILFSEVSYRTDIGEKVAVTLPDGSQVLLNAKSQITHRRFFWQDNKSITLLGEALFTIQKGDGFTVKTEAGRARVLGTQFNVRSRSETIEVRCYEGRVLFENGKEHLKAYLEAGDAVTLRQSEFKEFKHGTDTPSWRSGSSSFDNTDLIEVIEELQYYYDIAVQYEESVPMQHFTGTFVHNDLDLALKSVFVPMGIRFELSEDKKTVSLNVP